MKTKLFLFFAFASMVSYVPANAKNYFIFPHGHITPANFQGTHSVCDTNGSMLPTIKQNQMIYFIPEKPKAGDVILYRTGKRIKIGRVIGMPGETVKINGNEIYIDNKHIKQKYLGEYIYRPQEKSVHGVSIPTKEYYQSIGGVNFRIIEFNTPESKLNFKPTMVRNGSYYVLGDNRDNSDDSRFNGLVNSKDLIGVVHPVVLSPSDLWSLYHSNEIMFEKNMLGKYIYVYGKVGSIKPYKNRKAEIVFGGKGTSFGDGVDCIMNNRKEVYGLESGQKLVVGGRIFELKGFHINDVGLYNCHVKK